VGGGGGEPPDQKVARARAVGRHAGAGRGLDDRGGRVATLHVREGRAPSATAARAPAWWTPCGQVCSWRRGANSIVLHDWRSGSVSWQWEEAKFDW
jgi:hypothetical protein